MTDLIIDTGFEKADHMDVVLDALLRQVPFEGWTDRAVQMAMKAAVAAPQGAEHIYAPEIYAPGGALGLLRAWSDRLDQHMLADIIAMDLETMRIRDKVTSAVWARLNLMRGHEEAARRALARLSLPDAAAQGAEQLWKSADHIWTAIGDVSEDYNYYTKRMILSAVIGTSLPAWLSDESDDKAEARAFLDRRIGNVMQFETFKGRALGALSGLPKPEDFTALLSKAPRRRRRRYRPYSRS